jgi:tetratricopeptide (TPR) repeat protein
MKIGPLFIEEMTRTLHLRRISKGRTALDKAEGSWSRLGPSHPHATELLLLLAQWTDVGYRDYHLLDSLLLRFSPETRRKLPLDDYLRLRLVEGFRSFSAEGVDRAIETFDFVLKAEPGSLEHQMATLAHFWKGRAHRKKGEYELALKAITQARELANSARATAPFTAVIQIHEGWLLFQNGLRKEALRLLSQAEAILKDTDDYLALGNIESARGRIVRRSGEYSKSLEHFDRAIAIYSSGNPNHRNLARTLVNAAYVKRLLALQLRKRIDSRARKPNTTRMGNSPSQELHGPGALHGRYQELCNEAILELQRAREIYLLCGNAGGLGAVIVNAGYLHLDRGDIDRAALEATEAYQIGLEKNDPILMARALVLQASTENAKIEEQLGEDVDTALHANHAKKFGDDALSLAMHTQNRRLLAAAYIARGVTAANELFQDWDLAKRCASEATNLIKAGENDHLVDDLAALKSHIMEASGINDTLRGWSEGWVGEKSFQQITEEFAEIVIPKVWLRENRKVSRVAECLSISPKKVRRILRSAGFHGVDLPPSGN